MKFNLNIDFIYQKHIDLVFHILAHIKVNNPSDLFSEPYIEKMSLAIQDNKIFLPQSAVKYYNQNFNRLGIINFLPFFTQNMEELIQLLRDLTRMIKYSLYIHLLKYLPSIQPNILSFGINNLIKRKQIVC